MGFLKNEHIFKGICNARVKENDLSHNIKNSEKSLTNKNIFFLIIEK